MGNSPLSGQGVSEPHDRDVKGVESTDGRPNKLAEEIRDNPSNPTPSHNLCNSAVFCALHDQLANLGMHVQLARCFSAVAELLVAKQRL